MRLYARDSMSLASSDAYGLRMYIISNNTCVFMNQYHHQMSLGIFQ